MSTGRLACDANELLGALGESRCSPVGLVGAVHGGARTVGSNESSNRHTPGPGVHGSTACTSGSRAEPQRRAQQRWTNLQPLDGVVPVVTAGRATAAT